MSLFRVRDLSATLFLTTALIAPVAAADLGAVPVGERDCCRVRKTRIFEPVYIVDQGPHYEAAIADSRLPVLKTKYTRRFRHLPGYAAPLPAPAPLRVLGQNGTGEEIKAASVEPRAPSKAVFAGAAKVVVAKPEVVKSAVDASQIARAGEPVKHEAKIAARAKPAVKAELAAPAKPEVKAEIAAPAKPEQRADMAKPAEAAPKEVRVAPPAPAKADAPGFGEEQGWRLLGSLN